MLRDLLIAILITVVAVILGITAHPVLFALLVLVVLFLCTRRVLASGAARR